MTDKYTFPASKEQEMLVLKNAGHGKAIHRKLAEAADKARRTFRQPEGSSDTMGVRVEGDAKLSAILTGLTVVSFQIRHGIGIIIVEAEQDGNTVYPIEHIKHAPQARTGEFTDDDALAVLLEEEEAAGNTPGTFEVPSGETVLGGEELESPKDTEDSAPQKPPQGTPGKLPQRPPEGKNPAESADGVLKRWFNRR